MKKTNSSGNTYIKFDTINDVKKYLNNHSDVITNQNSSHKEGRNGFFGTETYTEFEDTILKNGNPELLKTIKKKVNSRVDELEKNFIEDTQYQFDVVGDFFDVGTFMSGEPEHWLKEIKIKEDKFIHIKIGGVYPHTVDTDVIRDNASELIALLRVMENKGYLTKIDVCFSSEKMKTRGKANLLIEIPLKDYNQPLDYRKVSILLDTSFFRRAIFRIYELTYPTNLKDGYGVVKNEPDYINLAKFKEVQSLEKELLRKDK